MDLKKAVEEAKRDLALSELLQNLLTFFRIAALIVAASAALDAFHPFPFLFRLCISCSLFLALAWCGGKSALVLLRGDREAASYINYYSRTGRALGAFEFLTSKTPVSGAPELIQAEIDAVERELDETPLPRPRLTKPLYMVIIWTALSVAVIGYGTGAITRQAQRIVFPWLDVPPFAENRIAWIWPPENYAVPYGGTLKAEVLIPETDRRPELIVTNTQTGVTDVLPLVPSEGNRWFANLPACTADTELRAQSGPARSAVRLITVAGKNRIKSIEAELLFPAYTGMPPEKITVGGNRLGVIEGTKITLALALISPADGSWRFLSGTKILGRGELEWTGSFLTGSLTITESGTLALSTGDDFSETKNVLIECIPDRGPELNLRFPPPLLVACEGSTVPVVLDARDDILITSITVTMGSKREIYPVRKQFNAVETSFQAGTPRQGTVTVSASSTDNRAPVPNTTHSSERSVRIVDRKSFGLLKKQNLLSALKQKLYSIKIRTETLEKTCRELQAAKRYTLEGLGPVHALVSAVSEEITSLTADPLFAEEDELLAPFMEPLEGLARQKTASIPETEEDRKAWLGFVRYFSTELLQVLERIYPKAEALSQADPFIQALTKASGLYSRQQAVTAGLKRGEPFGKLLKQETALADDLPETAVLLKRTSPRELAALVEKIVSILTAPSLTETMHAACAALENKNGEEATAQSERIEQELVKINKAVREQGSFQSLDLIELLASLSQANRMVSSLGLEPDSYRLWGPGAATERPAKHEDSSALSGKLTVFFTAHPELAPATDDFYAPLIKSYKRMIDSVTTGKQSEDRP